MLAALRRIEPAAYVATGAALAAAAAAVGDQTSPTTPLVAAAGLGVVALALANPLVTLYVAVALVPFELFSFDVGIGGLSPAETVFALSGFAWFLRRLAEGKPPYAPSPLNKPFLILLIALIPGLAIAPHTSDVVKNIVMWTAFLLVFEMVVCDATPNAVARFLAVLAVSGAVVALIGIAQSGQGPQLAENGATATGRAVSTLGDPNILGSFLALTIPAALVTALRGPGRLRPVGLVCFVVTLAGLGLSLSRGGIFAAVGAIAVMLLWKPMRRAALIVTAVVVTAIVAGSNPLGGVQQVDTILARVSTVSASQQGDTDRRTTIWRTTPQIIVDHPVFGVGAKQFSTVAPSYGLVDPATNETFLHAHNIWLTIAAELGIIALAALIWWTVALIAVMTRACRRAPPSYRGLAFAVSAALVSIGVQGLVDYTVRSNVIAATMCALAALAVVLARSGDSGPTSPAARGS